MPQEKTNSNALDTLSEMLPAEYDPGMSDAAVLRYIASQLEQLMETCQGLEKRIDHADGIAHAIDQKCAHLTETLEAYRPLLDKWADPGKAVRGMLFPGAGAAKRKAP